MAWSLAWSRIVVYPEKSARVGGQTRRLRIEMRGEQLERGLGDPALGALLILAGP